MLKLALCNELLAADGLSLDRQCEVAAELGYMGLELALGSLVERPHEITDVQAAEIRKTVAAHGLTITGLHWLLAPYPELSVTDPARQDATRDVLIRLVDLCGLLGGRILVHGSPAQRAPLAGESAPDATKRLTAFFAPIARAAQAAGVTYCIEPLARAETPVVNTVAEAAVLVEAVGAPAFRTMIDCSAAGQAEATPVADLLRDWLPTGVVAHVHFNDTKRGAPGMGSDPFPRIVAALRATGWPHPVAVEPFRTCIDGTTTAAIGAATLRACWHAAAPTD